MLDILESSDEDRFREEIEKAGGIAIKLDPRGNRGRPDRLAMLPVPPEHQEIVARYVRFVELKRRKGGRFEHGQPRAHEHLRELGYKVEVLRK